MSAPRSILVVGAGISGATSALELRRRGHDVTLLDPGPLPHPDASSTDVSKAVRADYGGDALYTGMMEAAFPGWEAWNREWGKPLYHETGMLFLAREPLAPGGFEHESFRTLKGRGHRLIRLTPDAVRARFPAWEAERYPDGYFNPRAGWAESGRVVERLVATARAEGVALREGVRFDRLLEEGSRVAGILTKEGERLRADLVLLATGASTPWLLPHLEGALWATGQPVLRFRPRDPSLFEAGRFPVWAADISRTGWYGFPLLPDGTLKVANHGTGRRVGPEDSREVAPEDEERFRDFFRESLPALADAALVATRLCLYGDTWDGNFWIDHDPDRPGLVVAAGDSGHGFKFAPVWGSLVADVVEGKENPWAARFRWRTPGSIATEEARFRGD